MPPIMDMALGDARLRRMQQLKRRIDAMRGQVDVLDPAFMSAVDQRAALTLGGGLPGAAGNPIDPFNVADVGSMTEFGLDRDALIPDRIAQTERGMREFSRDFGRDPAAAQARQVFGDPTGLGARMAALAGMHAGDAPAAIAAAPPTRITDYDIEQVRAGNRLGAITGADAAGRMSRESDPADQGLVHRPTIPFTQVEFKDPELAERIRMMREERLSRKAGRKGLATQRAVAQGLGMNIPQMQALHAMGMLQLPDTLGLPESTGDMSPQQMLAAFGPEAFQAVRQAELGERQLDQAEATGRREFAGNLLSTLMQGEGAKDPAKAAQAAMALARMMESGQGGAAGEDAAPIDWEDIGIQRPVLPPAEYAAEEAGMDVQESAAMEKLYTSKVWKTGFPINIGKTDTLEDFVTWMVEQRGYDEREVTAWLEAYLKAGGEDLRDNPGLVGSMLSGLSYALRGDL